LGKLTRGGDALAGGEDGTPQAFPFQYLVFAAAIPQFALHFLRDASIVLINDEKGQSGTGLMVAVVVQGLFRRKPSAAGFAPENEVLGLVCRRHMASKQ
jgi:hypothetical protein